MGYLIPRLVISLSKKKKKYLKIAFIYNMEIGWEIAVRIFFFFFYKMKTSLGIRYPMESVCRQIIVLQSSISYIFMMRKSLQTYL
jgi:hypothetical protein